MKLREQLVKKQPSVPNHRSRLATLYNSRGELLLAMNDEPRALESYEKALAICRRLVEEDPADPERHSDLAAALANLGTVQKARKDWRAATEYFVRSLEQSAVHLKSNRANPNGQRYYLQALSDLVAVGLVLHEADTVTAWNAEWRRLMAGRRKSSMTALVRSRAGLLKARRQPRKNA